MLLVIAAFLFPVVLTIAAARSGCDGCGTCKTCHANGVCRPDRDGRACVYCARGHGDR